MSLRDEMPITAAWIDGLRAAFGRDAIDGQIRRGLRGEAAFYAAEGGRTVGTRAAERGRTVSAAEMVIEKPKNEQGAGRG